MTASDRPTVLICVGVYLPGYRGGGPIRSISNLVDNLADSFDFRVLTLDRDIGVDTAFEGVEYGKWLSVGRAAVRYLSPLESLLPNVIGLVSRTPSNLIYLNTVFPTPLSTPVLFARRLGLLSDVPVIVCPRGHLHPGALAQKQVKKSLYLMAANALGLYKDVLWHATNEEEAAHIRSHFGIDARVQIAPNLGVAPTRLEEHSSTGRKKVVGQLRAVFLSRITPKKNLIGALRLLRDIEGDVVLDVYGPIGDEGYWSLCQREIETLPANVRVEYHGATSHDQVFTVFEHHDLLLLPTRGENFGHVIFEALSSGCPVLISDQTPWRDLRDLEAGWDLPLDSPQKFEEKLQWCTDASEDDYQPLRDGARRLAQTATASKETVAKVREVFERAISGR